MPECLQNPEETFETCLLSPKTSGKNPITLAQFINMSASAKRFTCIGEICRSIRAREYEHKRAIKNMDENHSGISKHVIETGHCIARKEVKILAFEADWKKRKIKDGICIEKARRNILITKPGVPVANVYYRYRVLN